jgi:betaine-aldehyde dehydrogenase
MLEANETSSVFRGKLGSCVAMNWIDGDWVDSARRLESIDPATGRTIGSYADGGEVEARRSIAAARRAFVETGWRQDRRLRARALYQAAEQFEASANDLVEILALENGMVVSEARFEVSMVPSKLRFYAAIKDAAQ